MRKLIFALIICVLSGLCASAEEAVKEPVTVNPVYSREACTIDVTGTADKAADGDTVTIMLLKPGYTGKMLDEESATFLEAVVFAGETKATDGKFTFDTIKLNPQLDVGQYTLRISAVGATVEKPINIATVSQVNDLMKNASTGSEVKTLVESYNEVYGLDMSDTSLFAKLSPETQMAVFDKMASDNPSTKDEIHSSYNLHTVLCKITEGPWTVLEDLIKTNETILTVTASDISKAYSAEEVYKSIVGKSYSNAAGFKTAFETAIAGSKAPVYSGGGTGGGSSAGSKGGGAVAYIPQTKAAEPEKTEEIFNDIASHTWAKESIEKLYNAGIVSGKSEGIFAPDDYVTRAEAAKMIALTFGCYNESAVAEFDDVQKNEWSYSYIASVAEIGIVSGYGDGIFGKNDLITRQDIAVMLYRAAEKLKSGFLAEGTLAFEDKESIAQYAADAVASLSEKGIINGINGRFMPTENATRAQMAKMLAAFVG